MPYPKGINTPEVRERFLADRRARITEYDRLRTDGLSRTEAARRVGATRKGVERMRQSVDVVAEVGFHHGGGTRQAIDLGLALLSVLRRPETALTAEDIAAWCGCSCNTIYKIEQRAIGKLRRKLLESTRGTDLAEEVAALFGGKPLVTA